MTHNLLKKGNFQGCRADVTTLDKSASLSYICYTKKEQTTRQ